MRVSELANELGKTSKEVLDIIKQKDSSAALFAASSVSKDQENMVRNAVSQKKEGAPKAEAEKAEPAKKKLTAVFRPQNAQQQIKRPVPKQQPKPQQAPAKVEETKPVQAAEVKPQVQEASAPAAESRPAQAERGDFQGKHIFHIFQVQQSRTHDQLQHCHTGSHDKAHHTCDQPDMGKAAHSHDIFCLRLINSRNRSYH